MDATNPLAEMPTHDNGLVEQNCAKLYLKSKRSDVYFVFRDDDGSESERVPAHKLILAAGSDVFDAMFYGPMKENDEIAIIDSSADAFKEFLQFFYFGKLQLSPGNLVDVTNLCKKYQVDDALKACEHRLKSSLTIDDMCWGYKVAQHLDLEELRDFCHEKIQENALEILKSTSFLRIDRALVGDVLAFLPTREYAGEIVVACMEWAKAKCARENLDPNSFNIRAQLGDLFDRIPFNKMTIEQFSQHTLEYSRFFNVNEIEEIIQGIANKRTVLDCDRTLLPFSLKMINRKPKHYTTFSTNRKLLLTQFGLNIYRSCACDYIKIEYVIGNLDRNKVLARAVVQIDEIRVNLPKPIVIHADVHYRIVIRIIFCCEDYPISPTSMQLKDTVRMDNGIEVKFFDNEVNGCVSNLKFNTKINQI